MRTVLITGGTGFIGTHLSKLLEEKGYKVIVLTRQLTALKTHSDADAPISYAHWDVSKELIDKDALTKADYIIHLAGAGVADKRWTKQRKTEIVESRTKSSALIVKALQETGNNIKAVISASAIGWYGENYIKPGNKEEGFKENDPPEKDFLGETCKSWEASIDPVLQSGIRLVKLRTGIVLSNEGGALTEFKKPLKAGIAAILGNGEQVISWIHIEDLCRMYLFAMENENLSGVYNAVAPFPVTNKQLTLALAKQLRGRFFMPVHVPSFVLKIMLGEMSIEVLKSATVSSEKIRKSGFSFLYPSIQGALQKQE